MTEEHLSADTVANHDLIIPATILENCDPNGLDAVAPYLTRPTIPTDDAWPWLANEKKHQKLMSLPFNNGDGEDGAVTPASLDLVASKPPMQLMPKFTPSSDVLELWQYLPA